MRSAYCSLPGSRSSRACSGRSPPAPCRASPGCDRARSARSRRLARAEHRAELALGLVVPLDPEVRDAQRLPDGRLVRLPFLRLLEGHGRLGSTALPEMAPALLEEIVGLAHLTPQGRRCPEGQAERRPSERRETSPRNVVACRSGDGSSRERREALGARRARLARPRRRARIGPRRVRPRARRHRPEPTVYRLAQFGGSRATAAQRADRPDSPRARRARRRRSVGIHR